jgi:hypothetical protein
VGPSSEITMSWLAMVERMSFSSVSSPLMISWEVSLGGEGRGKYFEVFVRGE